MSLKSDRWTKNRAHWTATLDAQNLRGSASKADLDQLLALFETEDVRRALDKLEPLRGRIVVDVGGGLGLLAILLARRGATAVIADLSRPRLQEARRLAEEAGVGDRVLCVCCVGEQFPFQTGGVDREITKSVLIHTMLQKTARELARALAPDGQAVFIEPLSRNPLVNLYRRLAAPQIWQEITVYFSEESIRHLAKPFRRDGRRVRVERMYFVAFLAGVFNYAVPIPWLYRAIEKALLGVDAVLFALLPALRKRAWFLLLEIGPRRK